jgi:hypothetical protein
MGAHGLWEASYTGVCSLFGILDVEKLFRDSSSLGGAGRWSLRRSRDERVIYDRVNSFVDVNLFWG